jgi:hypothetical protein
MNGSNDLSPVGIFSMMPGINSEDNSHVLSTMLSNNERREEYPLQFNNALIESFLKQQQLNTPPIAAHVPSDGIVPDLSHGMSSQAAYHAPPPPIPVVVPSMSSGSSNAKTNSKRKAEQDEVAVNVDPTREMTPEEKLLMKKQRRLVKNREAAQLFRQRQKEYISNLELKAAELTTANTEANARVELLASENKLMKEQLIYLRNFMKQAVAYSFPLATTMPMGQVPIVPPPASPTLSSVPTNPSFSTGALEDAAYHDIRIRGDISSLAGTANTTRPAIITTADGTSLSVNMGMMGSLPMPVSPFPLSFMPLPMMPIQSSSMPIPTPTSSSNPSHSPASPHCAPATPTTTNIGVVPNKDDKDLLPD